MAGPPRFDFHSDLQQAGQTAGEQEQQSRQLLRELVFSRAEHEPEFKRALAANPEKVLQEEARRMGAELDEALIQETKERYSTAIIGASEREVTKLVFDTLWNVRKSFERTLALSQWLFYVGLGLTVTAFLVGVFAPGKEMIAGIFGGGGILTLISYAVMNPLDRIRNAAANLVQIQIAYVSYYKQLNMLGGAGGDRMSLDDAVKYSSELRKGAVEMIEAVQRIVERTAPFDLRVQGSSKDGGEASKQD